MTWLTWIAARPDGVLFALGDQSGRIRIVMPADNRVVATHDTGTFVRRLGWTADGRYLLATADRGRLLVYGADGGSLEHELATGHEATQSFGVHPTEPIVVTAGSEGAVKVFDLGPGLATRTPKLELPAEKSGATVAGLTNGQIYAGYESGVFVIWDLSGKELSGGQLMTSSYISACCARSDGTSFVFAGGRGSMAEITNEWRTGQVWRGHPPRPIATNSLELAPDGRMLAAHSDDTASLFANSRDSYARTLGHAFWVDRKPWEQAYIVSSACFVPQTKLALTSHFGGYVHVWEVDGFGRKLAEIRFDGDEPTWSDSSPIPNPSAWWLEKTT